MRVGQEYRIVPVALPNGVFHPKIIYLANDERQLLLIGSGNVTFGGHGKNTEVFEALSSEQHASVFSDFADFLESLGSHPEARIPNRFWIDDFAQRARQAANTGVGVEGAPLKLIHPIDRTAIEQLPEEIADVGDCKEVRIVSPYHDPDGEAVHRLILSVGALQGVVAVTSDTDTPFPFDAAKTWLTPVTAKKPDIEGKRFVHAKWMEFDCSAGRFLFTGSFNATRKALATNDNVELGVLRRVESDDQLLNWISCESPVFAPNERYPSGLGSNEIVHASFDRNNTQRLSGQLITLRDLGGTWQYRLTQADGLSHEGAVDLEPDGTFEILDPVLEAFSELPALQIALLCDDREARGWVHNELLLNVGARRRLTAGALSRLMRRDGSDDDIQALLDYLSISADRHLRLFSSPIVDTNNSGKGSSDQPDADLVRVHLDELTPTSELHDDHIELSGDQLGVDDQFDDALARVRRMILGHGRSRSTASNEGLASSVLAEDEASDFDRQTSEQVAYTLGLSDFETAIDQMIAECDDQPEKIPGLCIIKLEVGMWMRLHRLDDIDGALEYLGDWLHRTSHFSAPSWLNERMLAQHFVTGSAICAGLDKSSENTSQLVSLHDDLERFAKGPVCLEEARTNLVDDVTIGFAGALSRGEESLDLAESLERVLATRTRRQQLAEALELRGLEETVPESWPVFSSTTGQALYQSLHRAGWEKRVTQAIPEFAACSFCYAKYPKQEEAVFASERIGRCVQCKKFSLDLNP